MTPIPSLHFQGEGTMSDTQDALDNILDFIMSDDSPMTHEDYAEVRQFDAVIAVAKTRVAVEAIIDKYLKGALAVAGKGHDTVPLNVVARHIKEMGDEISDVMRKGGEVWSTDIEAAPRGKTVVVEQWRKTADGVKLAKVETFAPDWIWAATAGGEVIKSHFVPANKYHPKGRWMNLHSESEPIAWLPFVKPSHPSLLTENPARAQ